MDQDVVGSTSLLPVEGPELVATQLSFTVVSSVHFCMFFE